MNNPTQWGLPADFVPVRYDIPDEAKNALRGLLSAEEPVVITLANEEQTATLVGTTKRLFVAKTGQMGTSAMGVNVAATANIREFPWEGIANLTLTPMTSIAKFTIGYRTSNGKTVEVGVRARMGKPAVEHIAGFESAAAQQAYRAMLQIWHSKRPEE
jgi:hypothetical protein